jgi:hypothetical protein
MTVHPDSNFTRILLGYVKLSWPHIEIRFVWHFLRIPPHFSMYVELFYGRYGVYLNLGQLLGEGLWLTWRKKTYKMLSLRNRPNDRLDHQIQDW